MTRKTTTTVHLRSGASTEMMPHAAVILRGMDATSGRPGTMDIKKRLDEHQRKLQAELDTRLAALIAFDWCEASAFDVAVQSVIDLIELGRAIIEHTDGQRPAALNISGADTGEVLFTLFGVGRRRAELWVGATPGSFQYVFSDGAQYQDGECAIAHYGMVASWLNGADRNVQAG